MPSELVASMAVTFIVPLVISLVQLAVKGLTDVSLMLACDLSDMFPSFLVIILATAFANNLSGECTAIALFVPTAMVVSEELWDDEETAQVARHLRSEAIAGLEDLVFGPEIFEDSPPSSTPSPPVSSGPNVEHITEQLMMGIKANWERYAKDVLVPLGKRFHLLMIDSPPTSLGNPSLVRRTPWSMRAIVPVEIVRLLLEEDRPTFKQFQNLLNRADEANTFHNFIDENHLVISTHKGFLVMGEEGFLTLHYNMLHGALVDTWDDSMAIPTIELLAHVECKTVDEAVSQHIEEVSGSTNGSSRIFHPSVTRTMDTSSISDLPSSASGTYSGTSIDPLSGNQDSPSSSIESKGSGLPIHDASLTSVPAEVSWLGRLNGDTSVEGCHVSFSQRVTS